MLYYEVGEAARLVAECQGSGSRPHRIALPCSSQGWVDGSRWLRMAATARTTSGSESGPTHVKPQHPSPRLPVPMAPDRQALPASRYNAAPTLPSFLLFQECFMVSVVSIARWCRVQKGQSGRFIYLVTCTVTCSEVLNTQVFLRSAIPSIFVLEMR